MGDAIRAIAREYGIQHGTIQARIKKENWTQEIATKVTNIKKNIEEISQLAKDAEMPIIEQRLHAEINEKLAIMKSLHELAKDGLSFSGQVMKKAKQEHASGAISSREASGIINQLGLSPSNIAKIAGIDTLDTTNSADNQKLIEVNIVD